SCLPKVTIKGPEALTWLAHIELPVPERVHGQLMLEGGALVIRTDNQEVFLEDSPESHRVDKIEAGHNASGTYRVRRQDASFLLTGVRSNAVLRETCGVDLSQPSDGVVLTRVAGVSAMILPDRLSDTPAFRFWIDPSYGPYFWKALLEIVRDHGG